MGTPVDRESPGHYLVSQGSGRWLCAEYDLHVRRMRASAVAPYHGSADWIVVAGAELAGPVEGRRRQVHGATCAPTGAAPRSSLPAQPHPAANTAHPRFRGRPWRARSARGRRWLEAGSLAAATPRPPHRRSKMRTHDVVGESRQPGVGEACASPPTCQTQLTAVDGDIQPSAPLCGEFNLARVCGSGTGSWPRHSWDDTPYSRLHLGRAHRPAGRRESGPAQLGPDPMQVTARMRPSTVALLRGRSTSSSRTRLPWRAPPPRGHPSAIAAPVPRRNGPSSLCRCRSPATCRN